MAQVNEQESKKPGPSGDKAAVSSWATKLSALSKGKFPSHGVHAKKPPIDKADTHVSEGKTWKDQEGKTGPGKGARAANVKVKRNMKKFAREEIENDEVVEGKTWKDSDEGGKKDKWAKIKAQRDAKKKGSEVSEEIVSELDLVEAVIETKPGNFTTIFDIIMKDKVSDLVAQKYAELTNEQFTPEEPEETTEIEGGDEEIDDLDLEDEVSEDEINELSSKLKKHYSFLGKKDAERNSEGDEKTKKKMLKRWEIAKKNEEVDEFIDGLDGEELEDFYGALNELSDKLKKRYAIGAKADVKKKVEGKKWVRPGLAKRLQKRWDTAKKVSEEECTDETNVKPKVHSPKSGNSEKKEHMAKTLAKLKSMSPTKVGK